MGAVAYDDGIRADRPPWDMTIWAVLRGYILALVCLGVPLTLLWYVGVPLIPSVAAEPGPWPVNGPWSLAADVSVFLVVVLVTTVVIRASAIDKLGRHVSPVVVFVAVALTGYAPFLHYRRVESGLVALLLTAAAVRYLGLGRGHSHRVGRAGAVLFAVVVAAGTLTAAAFALTHPLGMSVTGSGFTDPEHRFLSASLRNGGRTDLRILSVDAPVSLVNGIPWESEKLVGTVVPGRDEITISFAERACPFEAVVRYELGGRHFAQRLVLDHC